jgi:hypothetical protein
MAQEYGGAQPIIDVAKKAMGWTQTKPKPSKPDPSYHAEMLEKANESFRKKGPGNAYAPLKGASKKTSRKRSVTKRGM